MNLFEIDPSCQYWVVRAGSKAISYQQFISSDCVALGHMDNIGFDSEGVITEEDVPELERRIVLLNSRNANREEPRQLSARLGQIKHFINDFQIGDTVFTLSKSRISIGTITSDAYIDSEPLFSYNSSGERVISSQPQILRRKVKWESHKLRTSLPTPISRSLGSQKTVFSLDAHQELLKHWLYGVYIENNELHFTTEINQTTDIAQFHLSEFQRIIQKLELFSMLDLDENSFDEDQLHDLYYLYGGEDRFTLTNKSIFTSPGHSWGKVLGDRATLIAFAFLITGCMGETITPVDSNDSTILNNKQAELTQAIEHIKTTTTLESHKDHLEAFISKPNKGQFSIDRVEVSNPITKSSFSPIIENDEENVENNEVSSAEIDDRYDDFPEISDEGDIGV